MTRTENPIQIDQPDLRELAVQAARVAKLEDAVQILEDFVANFVNVDRFTDIPVWEGDPLEVALSVVNANYEEADQALEVQVTERLARSEALLGLSPRCP